MLLLFIGGEFRNNCSWYLLLLDLKNNGDDTLLLLIKLGEPIHSQLSPVLLHTVFEVVVVEIANGVDLNLADGGGVTGFVFWY